MEAMMEDSCRKGKRTSRKRQRLQLSSAAPATGPSSSSSAEFSEITTAEEEDMAKCLILLAQGSRKPEPAKFTSRRFAEAATTSSGKAGFFVYECKSCNKCFPSFQALGGHRASHKKPKISLPSAPAGETAAAAMMNDDSIRLNMGAFSLQAPAKTRIHECSVCNSKFSSGQALGGHMRRHRPLSLHGPAAKKEETSNRLLLDLNLPPAPCDDDGDLAESSSPVSAAKAPSFSFASNKQPILMLASSFVDCHYGSDSNSNISQ